MKNILVMERCKEYKKIYTYPKSSNWLFNPVSEIFSRHFDQGELFKWLMDEKQRSIHTEFVCIEKERGVIAIYDISDFLDDRYSGEFCDPSKSFTMSIKNFAQVVMQ